MNKCVYCNKKESQFNSVCVPCDVAIRDACIDCFQKWSYKHEQRPRHISVNKWNGGSHLINQYGSEGFDEYISKYNIKLLYEII